MSSEAHRPSICHPIERIWPTACNSSVGDAPVGKMNFGHNMIESYYELTCQRDQTRDRTEASKQGRNRSSDQDRQTAATVTRSENRATSEETA